MQAKEEGRKMHRMKVMLRQFVAYVFYLWLLMVIVYVNFQYSTYLLTRHLENSFVHTENNGYVTFNNISRYFLRLKHQSRLQQTSDFATSFPIFDKNKV